MGRAHAIIQREVEASAPAARVRDFAIESSQAREQANHAKACVVVLEGALMHQASTHTRVVDAMASQRDGLRT